MPKPSSKQNINNEASITLPENETISSSKSMLSGLPNKIKGIFSNFDSEDILILIVLFILIEEGIEDDILIIGLFFLLLT